jgi:HK97 family phage portal protein
MLTRESLPPSMVLPTVSGEQVTDRSALAIADVFACVRALSDGAVLCPLECYRDTDAGRVPLTGGRGPALLREPQPGLTQSAFAARLVEHCALFGECFVGKIRDGDGQLVQLEPLSPDRVVVQILDGAPTYTYYSILGGVFEGLGVEDVIHVAGMRDPTGVRGASPISLCREALGLASNLSVSASATWANGAVPSGILTVPPGPAAEEQLGVLSDAWAARHQGARARGRIAVVSGDVKFSALTMPLSDAEFIATRKLSTAEISRILRVPVSVIGGSSGDSLTYRTTESEAQAFVTFGLGPWLKLIEDAISLDRELLPGESAGCRFNMDALLRADTATRAAVAVQLVAAGVMSREEARALNGLSGPPPPMPTDSQQLQAFAQGLARSGVLSGETAG